MGTIPVEFGSDWDALLRAWWELDVPEGWRAEILEGGVTVSPPPGNGHNLIADLAHRGLVRAVPVDWSVLQTLGVSIPGVKRLYEPDLVVVPRAELVARPDQVPVPAVLAKLAVEIVSRGNARTDRVEKLWAYAQAPVPLYLLIDRFDDEGPTVTLFSEPVDGHYRTVERVPFGDSITLPSPIDLVLDTKEF
ncbi:Uma2 family endonuclease [Amycolatopsis rhizosphaerae]|uniref:Uma2 family endonuclease n=1 Tax=Amycolatopsis rhizosphaerae TaxID=2053003 RepID=A0A558DDS8_9PSEU|nr:Uma2 family endonuclease [Amycolatopsis rhizosphaerae]TVT59053.1 Uma2 family endonuclease [Amycolatopsis rhizosphaerae]